MQAISPAGETEEDAKMAEQDWERVTHQYGTRARRCGMRSG
jgi:hypothetical protein